MRAGYASNFLQMRALPQSRCNSTAHDPDAQEIEAGAAIHGPFAEFELINLAFDWARTPGRHQRRSNGVDVADEASSKGRERAGECLLQPIGQGADVPGLDHGLEAARQTCRPGDFRRCIAECLCKRPVWLCERVPVRRQKACSLTGRWRPPGQVDQGWPRLRGRRILAQSDLYPSAEGLGAPAVSLFADLTVELGRVPASLRLALAQIIFEGFDRTGLVSLPHP